MKRISFRDSIASKLLLAIIAFPALLTLSGFFIFQRVGNQRIVEFSEIKMRQLEHFNSTLLLNHLDSFKEKAIRIASDNQIIVPYKLKVHFQLKAHLEKLFDLNELGTLSVLSPEGISDITVGRPVNSYRFDMFKTLETAQEGQPSSSYVKREEWTNQNILCLAATTPILSGNEVIAVLLIAKDVILSKPFSNTLLVSEGRVQSESIESSFLSPLIAEATKTEAFGPISLSDTSIAVSKIAFPGLNEPDSYLLCGVDEHSSFDQNKKIALYGIIMSIGILLCLSGYSIYLSRRLTRPLLHMVNVADRIAEGNFKNRLAISSMNEIGHLSHSFNRMMESLAMAEKALKQSNDRLLLIMDSLYADIYVADFQTYEVLFMNKTMQKNFGSDMTGQLCYAAFRNENEPCAHCTNSNLLDADGSIGQVYIWECTNPVTGVSYINYDRAIHWVDGRIARMQIATDVSARKKAEDRLKRINDELEDMVANRTADLSRALVELENARQASESANISKSQFLANMSHEIRTPMNGVLGIIDLVLHTELSDKQRADLAKAKNSGELLLTLINDILDLSRIEAGELILEDIPLNFPEIVEEVLELLAEGAYAKGLEVLCLIDPKTPSMLRGDPTRLRQILLNLVNNAIKFTKAGEIVIRADCMRVHADRAEIRVEVQDSGVGVAPEVKELIFDPFRQADGTTTRRFGGTGLGLAIAKQLVTAMGGDIGVDTEPGRGSTFWFSIPMLKASSCGQDGVAPGDHFRDVKTLIGSSSTAVRQALMQLTTAWGMRSEIIDNGKQALSMILGAAEQGEPYQILILNSPLPDLDLMGLTEALKTDAPTARPKTVLLLSPRDVRDGNICGDFDVHFTKPVVPNRLHTSLKSLLSGVQQKSLPETTEGKKVHFDAHILVAEDNPINQEVTSAMLTLIGCRVDVVSDGRQALAALAGTQYDLVFMDCQMPEMDGYEATTAIRAKEATGVPGARTLIIAVTAHAMEGDRDFCLAAGMDDYLTKPFNMEKLQAILARWLPGGQDQQEAEESSGRIGLSNPEHCGAGPPMLPGETTVEPL